MITECILTGSFAYGTPCANSDIDLALRCDRSDVPADVSAVLDASSNEYEDSGSIQAKSGKINYIFCFTDECFSVWKTGTEELSKMRPVSREFAVSFFAELRKKETGKS